MIVENLGRCTNLLSVTTLCPFQRADCRLINNITRKKLLPISYLPLCLEQKTSQSHTTEGSSRSCCIGDQSHATAAVTSNMVRWSLNSDVTSWWPAIYTSNTSYRCHRSRTVDTACEHGCHFGHPCSRDTAREHGRWTRVVCTLLNSLVFDFDLCCCVGRSQMFASERKLTFTFAICCRPSVCLSSVCLSSVTLVHPT